MKTYNRSYTVNDYDDLFDDMGYPFASTILKTVTKAWIPEPPNVKVFCFHGIGVPTPGSLKYAPGTFPDYMPIIDYVDGDKTVPLRSLKACLLWRGKQKQRIVHKMFKNAKHVKILEDIRLMQAVVKALQTE